MPAQQRTEECGINNMQCGTFCHGRVSGDSPINLSRTMLCLSCPFSMSCCSCNPPQPCLPTAPTQPPPACLISRHTRISWLHQLWATESQPNATPGYSTAGTVAPWLYCFPSVQSSPYLHPSCQTLGASCCLPGSSSRWEDKISEVPSSPNLSMILFYDSVSLKYPHRGSHPPRTHRVWRSSRDLALHSHGTAKGKARWTKINPL